MVIRPNTTTSDNVHVLRKIDWKQVEIYLESLVGNGYWNEEVLAWQFLDDDKDRKDNVYLRLRKEFGFRTELRKYNERGYGIFVTINKTNGKGRKSIDIVEYRAVWADWDDPTIPLPTTWPLQPHMIVESSPGKYHVYWLCEPLKIDIFEAAIDRIVELGGCPGAKGVNRVLRVPGFYHQKRQKSKGTIGTPHLVNIVTCNKFPRYLEAEIAAAFPAPVTSKGSGHASSENPPEEWTQERDDRLCDALKVVPAETWVVWLRVGMAIQWLGWGDRGKEIWDDWSQTFPDKYKQADQDTAWDSFDGDKSGKKVTISSVFMMARDNGCCGQDDSWTKTIGLEHDDGGWKFYNVSSAQGVSLTLSDVGNAHRLVQKYGEDIRYVHPYKSWFIWEDGFWKEDKNGEIMRRAEATIESMFDAAKNVSDSSDKTKLRQFALASQSIKSLHAMESLARNHAFISPDDLDANDMLLGVLNGTIELSTQTFRDGLRRDYITKRCNVSYDPEAKCPEWIKFQTKISNSDADLVKYKQRLFGLCLTGIVTENLIIKYGSGANGKTTELETIKWILGDYAYTADTSVLIAPNNASGPTPELLALKGKRVVFINETEENEKLSEKRSKLISSKDDICARGLHKDPVNFKPTHKPIIRTNHKPKIRGTGLGMWRRIHLVPYLVTISEKENNINFKEEKLVPEGSGILNWMLDGLRDYLEVGLKPPASVCAATKDYKQEMDIVGKWVAGSCGPSLINADLPLKTIHDAYSEWAIEEIGWVATSKKLAEALRDHGYISKFIHGKTIFENIRLTDPDSPGL